MKVTGGCIWNTTQTIIVQKTEQMEKDTFLTTLAVQSQQKTVPVTIHFIGCKQKSFWDPRTWFMCVEENRGEITIQGSYIPMYSGTPEIQNSSASSLSCTHTRTMSSIHVTENAIVLMTAAYNGIPVTITEYSPKKTYDLALTYPTTPAATAFLSWMLPTGSGVSQWHGKTAYQNPHTGIDFSVYKAPITVPATGTIVSAAYNQKSACFAGGNYIAIKHSNGLYTYYFHLDSLKNSNGKTITTGTTVQQGAMLAITGNSGYFNCEPLAYHLHFEVRTAQDPATHLNPVPYINTDWSKIVTVGTKLNPGRLSGDNPHPNY